MSPVDDAIRYLEENREEHLRQLFDLLRIESVSADPSRSGSMVEAASWLASELERIGATGVEIVSTPLHPVVLGAVDGSQAAPTVLIYGHYDVQPEDPVDEWDAPPFEPSLRDGAIFARGSTDDKGQLFMHLKAVEALVETGNCPVNVRFVFEGEEEIGSDSLVNLLETRREELTADLAIVSDSPMFANGIPSIGYGLRGLCYQEIRLSGPGQDLHSGQFGGAVVNPAAVLIDILHQLHHPDGSVAVPGFYDDVREIDPEERKAIADLPFDEPDLLTQVGAPALGGESGFSVLERLWLRPTLEINGLTSGYQGPGAKTIVPARATAKISCRLVPDQDHQAIADLVTDRITALAPKSVNVDVKYIHGALPWVVSPTTPAFGLARESLKEAFGVDPVLQRDGGSIPVVPQLAQLLGVTTMLLGFGVPDENKHAPNEHLLMTNYEKGTETMVRLLRRLGDLDGVDTD